ncbi:uncharacterized protein K452DRAFT_291478 [Aplosporella prunicola CBS 121167]|uniref:Uncharacterized protein n=1 Tax=Aplosporella prunicola CBS 121167 TaxID=1176127 RepID=A0A6A6B4I3_9PEZI|nr:uncharacterized protein K452DRAFT_291478 [Aplosporella prunicola CBS 121167]KAF2137661.1 hypothetical protein K452DRAFT_291478 [Aplosporella prunicola CBS 121167]
MAVNGDATPGQLVEQLAVGFDALSSEYRILYEQHRELENKLSWAKQQYLDLLKRFTPDIAIQDHKVFVQSLEEVERHGQAGPIDWLDALAQSRDGDRRTGAYIINQAERARDQLKNYRPRKDSDGVKIWNGTSGDRASERISKLESLRQAASAAGLERDFTTPGTPSKLGCPFATPSARGRSLSGRGSIGTPRSSHSRILPHAMRSKRSSFNDPIRAEICGIEGQSPEPSVAGSNGPICPIRFMDQHSPEEIAKYFETHKHELPRSHEICVKRFQSNADSIRELDAKYGNLVSMIKGLGEKHQPMLPTEPAEDEEAILESTSQGRVAKWAKTVSTSAQAGGELSPDLLPNPEQPLPEEEERKPHFDRPLKDVRVGESPSRPWGITVPARYNKAPSVKSEDSLPTASPAQEFAPEPKPTKCPFDHTKMGDGPPPKPTPGLVPEPAKCPFGPAKVGAGPPSKPVPEPVREPAPEVKPAKCPFDHMKMRGSATAKPEPTIPQPDAQTTRPTPQTDGPAFIQPVSGPNDAQNRPSPPQMVFTGPVFIGYSVEQAAAILQQNGFAGKS